MAETKENFDASLSFQCATGIRRSICREFGTDGRIVKSRGHRGEICCSLFCEIHFKCYIW